jgi:hypothetical protein
MSYRTRASRARIIPKYAADSIPDERRCAYFDQHLAGQAGAARMGEFLSGAGVIGEPEVTMLDAVDVAGQF